MGNSMICEDIQAFLKKGDNNINSLIEQLDQSLILTMNEPKANPFLKVKDNPQPTQTESECPRCQQTGMTTFLLVDIPLFREILLGSFRCEECGQTNSEVQFAGRLPDLGVEILFRCLQPKDLDRQIIRSEFCTLLFEELELELPTKKAEVTNIEALLKRTLEDLSTGQQQRKVNSPDEFNKIETFLNKVKDYVEGKKFPLSIKIRDPSGNSTIKNPYAPRLDKQMEITYFRRTLQELQKMGYSIENAKEELQNEKQRELDVVGNKLNFAEPFEEEQLTKHEPMSFEVPCEVCLLPGSMKSCRTSVPYFSDIVIMSFSCDYCGHHTTQTKNSGQIGEQALIITLNVEKEEDLKRDLFKSQTCYVGIPELELELDYGTLGGVFTTVEGLLQKVHHHLADHNPFVDSDQEFGSRMKKLFDEIEAMRKGKIKFTLQLIDPLARSFLQNPYHPHNDPNARRDLRDRTFEENEMLGINDMKVENYT